jgi:ABC-type nitrate/sulfonate/bicarbonate transport system substrate-binding protein
MPTAIARHGLRARLFASLLGILFVATAASAQQKPKLRPLRIALPSHSVSATAVYVARSLGIFERYGFDPQILVLEPRAALAAMLTGDLDFYAAVGTVGRAALTGVPVRVVVIAANRSDLVLLASKEITTVEQLRGKALGGYTAQASVNVILTELLRFKGLRPDEYTILNVGTARAVSLMSGNVPAAVVNGVEAARLVRNGFHVLARERVRPSFGWPRGVDGGDREQTGHSARRGSSGSRGRSHRRDTKRKGATDLHEAIRP